MPRPRHYFGHNMSTRKNSYALVLAGGSGTRLWPLSRKFYPKQLLSLDNDSDSLLIKSVKRILKRLPVENIFTITAADNQFEVVDQLCQIDEKLKEQILIEPEAKNTLPAAAWGTQVLYKKNPLACIAVFPSDHLITTEEEFLLAWELAEQTAETGLITLLGIEPTKPAIEYGYIKVGKKIKTGVHMVDSFEEKPQLITATNYLEQGNYCWNAGIFAYKASVFLENLEKHAPITFALSQKLLASQSSDTTNEIYQKFPNISIDYGLIEKIHACAVVKTSMDWQDLGSWEAIYHLKEKDEKGNALTGDCLAVDCRNNLLWSDQGWLTAFGVENLAIIQTADATLVCPRDKAAELKELTQNLSEKTKTLLETHQTVFRPWGSYTVLQEDPGFKVKKISVKPGGHLSKQFHNHRSEHWVVIAGEATIETNNNRLALGPNESTFIGKRQTHRLSNETTKPLVIIEIQVGEYLGEDDIVRIEDKYGR